MEDASPAKWHRAHTSWFFEQFLLLPHAPSYQPFDPDFSYLFNSYYESVGARHPRFHRGMITRPGAKQVDAYRAHVDQAMAQLQVNPATHLLDLLELGLQHEQQHQELLMTDMLHGFAQNPLAPAMLPRWSAPPADQSAPHWIDCPGGLTEIGHQGGGFAFDNETPRHSYVLRPYQIASHLVRNGDYLAFVQAGGYRTPLLWMTEGYAASQAQGWTAPLHWRPDAHGWMQMTPAGLLPLDEDEPVRHISWYEADAFARWAGARLPTEMEWEQAAAYPALAEAASHVWQWTSSAYGPYPGFKTQAGAIGEYNGKFMINQMVLRGGSMATPPGHTRATYRNFFHPDKRWQFTGLRLARDCG